MLIAHVIFTVAEADQEKALEVLMAETTQVRTMQGCIAFIPFLDATSPGRVGVLHEWQTEPDFAKYTTSPDFARVGKALRALVLEPPISRRFDATLIDQLD